MSFQSFKKRFSDAFHALELHKCRSDLERLWAILDAEFERLSGLELAEGGPGKSLSAFTQWKEKGNALLGSGALQEACTAYTRALFAAPSSEERAVAFGNRSAALLRLGLARESLADIEASLDCGFPTSRRFRLVNRAGECRLLLGELERAREDFEAALQLLTSGQCDLAPKQAEAWQHRVTAHLRSPGPQAASLRRFRCDRPPLPPLCGPPSADLPCAAAVVELRTTPEEGRGLFVREAVRAGSVLVVERPYANSLIGERFLTHCARCLVRSPALRACRSCAEVGFCSAACENEAWAAFHRYECSVMAQIASLPNIKIARLAYRTIVQTDLAEVRAPQIERSEAKADSFCSSFRSGRWSVMKTST